MLWTGPPNLDCLACRVSFLQVEEKGLITSWGGYVFPPISRFSLFLTPNLVSASSHLRYCKDELSILLQVQGCVESSYVTGWEIVADTVSFVSPTVAVSMSVFSPQEPGPRNLKLVSLLVSICSPCLVSAHHVFLLCRCWDVAGVVAAVEEGK